MSNIIRIRFIFCLRAQSLTEVLYFTQQTAPSVQKPAAAALSTGHSAHPAQGESSPCSDLSGYKRPLPPLSATQRVPAVRGSDLPYSFLPSDPGQWNIDDVYEFISSLPGGSCLNRDTFVHGQMCRSLLAPRQRGSDSVREAGKTERRAGMQQKVHVWTETWGLSLWSLPSEGISNPLKSSFIVYSPVLSG